MSCSTYNKFISPIFFIFSLLLVLTNASLHSSNHPVHPTPVANHYLPTFAGFQNQHYSVEVEDDGVYNLITDHQTQFNALFKFLGSGECPPIKRRSQEHCFSGRGVYLHTLAIKTLNDIRLVLVSGPAAEGFSSILLNNRIMGNGDFTSLLLNVTVNSTHLITISAGLFTIVLENSDNFLNLVRVLVNDPKRLVTQVKSHGLLGQTWMKDSATRGKNVIEGSVLDYRVWKDDLFGTHFLFNKFGLKSEHELEDEEN